ncbi:MAG: nucleoside deaminase, partial [Burkholderiaceae bacterium]
MKGQGCSNNDAHWMGVALQQAQLAAERGEVPVGAVVVRGNQLVAASHNAPIALHDPTAHAEIRALRAAGQALNNYRLSDC